MWCEQKNHFILLHWKNIIITIKIKYNNLIKKYIFLIDILGKI